MNKEMVKRSSPLIKEIHQMEGDKNNTKEIIMTKKEEKVQKALGTFLDPKKVIIESIITYGDDFWTEIEEDSDGEDCAPNAETLVEDIFDYVERAGYEIIVRKKKK